MLEAGTPSRMFDEVRPCHLRHGVLDAVASGDVIGNVTELIAKSEALSPLQALPVVDLLEGQRRML